MSDAAHLPELASVEEYLAADGASEDVRLEYVAGHVFALAGATKRHALIAGNVYARLHAATEGSDCRVYQSDVRLRISRDLYFYPDVMLACGGDRGLEDPMDETSPIVLVEVMSESTASRDVGVKLAAYRDIPTLLMYLVVSQDERRVEVHARRRADGPWEHRVARGSETISIRGIDAALSLDQIYARLAV